MTNNWQRYTLGLPFVVSGAVLFVVTVIAYAVGGDTRFYRACFDGLGWFDRVLGYSTDED